jgi:hypothetical protein
MELAEINEVDAAAIAVQWSKRFGHANDAYSALATDFFDGGQQTTITPAIASVSAPTSSSSSRKKCQGVCSGNSPGVLLIVAKSMENNAQRLRDIAREQPTTSLSFSTSDIGTSPHLLPMYNGTVIFRADDPSDGYVIRAERCTGVCSSNASSRCSECASHMNLTRSIRKQTSKLLNDESSVGKTTTIKCIVSDRNLAEAEIRTLREENKRLCTENTRKLAEAETHKLRLENKYLYTENKWRLAQVEIRKLHIENKRLCTENKRFQGLLAAAVKAKNKKAARPNVKAKAKGTKVKSTTAMNEQKKNRKKNNISSAAATDASANAIGIAAAGTVDYELTCPQLPSI